MRTIFHTVFLSINAAALVAAQGDLASKESSISSKLESKSSSITSKVESKSSSISSELESKGSSIQSKDGFGITGIDSATTSGSVVLSNGVLVGTVSTGAAGSTGGAGAAGIAVTTLPTDSSSAAHHIGSGNVAPAVTAAPLLMGAVAGIAALAL